MKKKTLMNPTNSESSLGWCFFGGKVIAYSVFTREVFPPKYVFDGIVRGEMFCCGGVRDSSLQDVVFWLKFGSNFREYLTKPFCSWPKTSMFFLKAGFGNHFLILLFD